jgi:hypothetical protein
MQTACLLVCSHRLRFGAMVATEYSSAKRPYEKKQENIESDVQKRSCTAKLLTELLEVKVEQIATRIRREIIINPIKTYHGGH